MSMYNWNLEPLSPSGGIGEFLEDDVLLDDAWQVLSQKDPRDTMSPIFESYTKDQGKSPRHQVSA